MERQKQFPCRKYTDKKPGSKSYWQNTRMLELLTKYKDARVTDKIQGCKSYWQNTRMKELLTKYKDARATDQIPGWKSADNREI